MENAGNELKVKEITIGLGITLNLGSYNNMRLDVRARAELPESMSEEEGSHKLAVIVRDALLKQVENVEIYDTTGIDALRAFAGEKPAEDEAKGDGNGSHIPF